MKRSALIAVLTAPLLLGTAWQQGPAAQVYTALAAGMPVQIYAGLENGAIYTSADGGTYWQEADTGIPTGVDVTTLAAGQDGSGIVYAGTAGAGIYSTIDGGRSWRPANGSAATLAGAQVRGLVVDPHTSQLVYAATANGLVFRSTDGGRGWSSQALPVGSQINALALDPLMPTTLFVGTAADGILISTDGGVSWQVPDRGTPQNVSVNALAFSPSNAGVAYAATDNGIYQTIDGGVTWPHQTRGIPDGSAIQTVAVDPAHGSHVVAGGTTGQIYRSRDGGTSWKQEALSTCCEQVSALLYDLAASHELLASTTDGTLNISIDGGVTWVPVLSTPFPGSVLCLAASSFTPLPTAPAPPPSSNLAGVRYFPQSHHTVRGAFLRFYTRYDGLDMFGLPLTEAFEENGQIVQYFERARLVLVRDQVRISPLGRWLTTDRRFPIITPFRSFATALYFPSTHHALVGTFLTFWRTHHGALLFGPPISDPLYEQNGDGTGRTYLVQYFQNARMEYHPELSGTRYVVLLGLLGQQYLQRRGWLP